MQGPTSKSARFSRPSPGERSDVERVKDASDIVRVLGEHIALKPKGREFIGLCPFHDDHSPSLNVVPHKQFYKCFSCGAAGDVLTFVQQFLKMEFRESLEYLADRAGIVLTPMRREASVLESGEGGVAAGSSKRELHEANRLACEFFRNILAHAQHGAGGRNVIEKRGVGAEMAREFLIGAAPDRWDGLLTTLSGKGVPTSTLAEAGLIKNREGSSGHYDTFRNRVIFPICDRTGRVIAFGARRIDDEEEPKYLNSPETPVFNKSATLYGLHLALRAIQRSREVVVCEGYTDVIACHQAGFRNVVATLGTALTRQHARELRLACDRVVLLFDSDEAGQKAADRATEVFFSERLDVSIVTLRDFTDAKDPDELLKREEGPKIFDAALRASRDLLEYRFARLRERLAGAGAAALERAAQDEVRLLCGLGLGPKMEPGRFVLVLRRLSAVTSLPEHVVRAWVADFSMAGRSAVELGRAAHEPQDAHEIPALHTLNLSTQEHLLGCLLCNADLWAGLREDDKALIAPGAYRFPVVDRVAQVIHELAAEGVTPALESVLARCADGGEKQAAITIMSRVYEETGADRARLEAHWRFCLTRAKHDKLRASGSLEPKPMGSGRDAGTLDERIKVLREAQQTLGADRRRVPRPG